MIPVNLKQPTADDLLANSILEGVENLLNTNMVTPEMLNCTLRTEDLLNWLYEYRNKKLLAKELQVG